MSRSRIEWLARPGTKPESWNPVTGCTKVSEGCRNCYAEVVAKRFWAKQYPWVLSEEVPGTGHPRQFTDVLCHEDRLALPISWRTPRTVFVNSMSDLFHEAVPDAFIDRVFAVMQMAPRHTFIVLTKRPERLLRYTSDHARCAAIDDAVSRCWESDPEIGRRVSSQKMLVQSHLPNGIEGWPLPNVWLGVSVENQATADARIPLLLDTPATVRFVSAEPLLGPVMFKQQNPDGFWPPNAPQPDLAWLRHKDWPDDFQYWTTGLDWVIVGGESGPAARPCDVAWIRDIVRQCHDAIVPCFVKQLGAKPIASACPLPVEQSADSIMRHGEYDPDPAKFELSNRKGADPSEWPAELRVRQWPAEQQR